MNLATHVNKICASALHSLHNIRKIRTYLTDRAAKTLINAVVTCRLDYCNSILHGLPANKIQKLQRVQNAASRLVFQADRFTRTSPLLKQLHWLPVKYRIQYKVQTLVYQAIHGQGPAYLVREMISIRDNNRYPIRSLQEGTLLNVPKIFI